MLQIINPATNTLITQLEIDTKESLQKKFDSLQIGQKDWSKRLIDERIEVLNNFKNLLKENEATLAATLTAEVGKPLQQSINEINGAVNRVDWLCSNAKKYLADEVMSKTANMIEKIVYEPLGVICNISAWNYPYLVGINVIVPALLAGNAVMYKPSEYASLTGLEIKKLLLVAGVPANVFEIAIGKGNTGIQLLDLKFDGYFFTGSYNTGKYIYEKVAPKMVPCQLELGGKDPLYVTDELTDIKATAIATADGAFYNNGQSCCAVERIYVHEKVYDKYVNFFIEEVKSWKIGNPAEEGIYIGALTRPAQIEVLEIQINEAIKNGATLVYGGKRMQLKGNFFEPTILTDVTNQMLVMQDESFGPIIGIMKVQNDDEAIAFMNDTKYGLTSSVYSTNEQRAQLILSQLNSGTGYWNCCDRVSAALPWSGRKHSGFGATLSHVGIRAFAKTKALHLKN